MSDQYDKGYERGREGKDDSVGMFFFLPSSPATKEQHEERDRGFEDGQQDRAREEHEKKNEK